MKKIKNFSRFLNENISTTSDVNDLNPPDYKPIAGYKIFGTNNFWTYFKPSIEIADKIDILNKLSYRRE